MHNFSFLKEYRIYISFFVLFVALCLLLPNEGRFKYEYQKGRPWTYQTLFAPFDIPVLKTDAELIEERESRISRVLQYYVYDNNVSDNAIRQFTSSAFAAQAEKVLIDRLASIMVDVYDRGIVSGMIENISDGSGIIFVQKGKRVGEIPVSELYDMDKAYNYVCSALSYDSTAVSYTEADSLLSAMEFRRFLVPNLSYDRKTTELMHKNATDYISPTKGIIYSGQLIVNEGEIVTADIDQMLDSYKAEYEMSYGYTGSKVFLYISHFLLALAIVILIYLLILFYNPFLFKQYRSICFILLMPLVIGLLSGIVRNADPMLFNIVPYAVFALYMAAFFKPKFVFPIYMVSLMQLLVFADNGIELYFMNVLAGAVGIISFHYFGKGWRQFLSASFIFLAILMMYLTFRFMEEGSFDSVNGRTILLFMCNAFFIVAAYPIVYLLEKVFGFLSNATLMDLADTSNHLLMDLAKKAPGTFQHSLQVANLSEAAAREIDADALLIRVGAMYHDIGKIQNPQCFIENQPEGVNYHANLTPLESAQAIISHVDDGVAIAQKAGLPEVIVDFIRTHHGHTQTLYFYNQFCNAGGDPEMIDKFTYNGLLPSKKEHAILMMADGVEAASRSLKDYSEASISAMVDRLCDAKIIDSQFVECEISLKEIDIVKDVFKKYLVQIYHARIAYPERKDRKR